MVWTVVGQISTAGGGGGTGGFTDSVTFGLEYAIAETLGPASDAYSMDATLAYAETVTSPTDVTEFNLALAADNVVVPTDARSSVLTRWATSNTTSGTAPTNPTNAQAEKNGTVATCKTGGLAAGTSGLVLTIAAPMGEISSGATRPLLAYYAFNAGTADTCAASVSYRQVGQGTNTTVALPSTGNYLTTPATVNLTNIDPSVSVTVGFLHSATLPATGGSITIDAVGIETTGAL